jgi:hypothetical protein
MNGLRKMGKFTDVDFKVGDRVLHAHKMVLSKYPFFAAMFDGPFKEGSTKEPILLPEIDAGMFWVVLEYIYTEKVVLVGKAPEYLIELAKISDKLGVLVLKQLCHFHLQMTLSAESLIEIATYANLHTEQKLFEACATYARNHQDLLDSTDLSKLAPLQLVGCLVLAAKLELKVFEEAVVKAIEGSMNKENVAIYSEQAKQTKNETLARLCATFAIPV